MRTPVRPIAPGPLARAWPCSAPGTSQCSADGPARAREPAPIGRADRSIGAAVDQQERHRLDQADDPARLRRPQVAADPPAGES